MGLIKREIRTLAWLYVLINLSALGVVVLFLVGIVWAAIYFVSKWL